MTAAQIVVMAKEPLPGKAKTRLAPAYGPSGAAALARAALLDTLDAALASSALRVVLALEGSPGDWLPPGLDVIAQHQGDFGGRLAGAMADAFETLPVPVLVIGMDAPQVTASLLDQVLAVLVTSDAVLGPADDGGFWCLGLQRAVPTVFDDVPMSLSTTGSHQRRRLAALGLRTVLVPGLRDVDEPEDAAWVAQAAPGTRFGALARQLGQGAA